MLCHGLFTHSLFISGIILHHAQCFYSVGFSKFYVLTVSFIERAMCSLDKQHLKITIIIIILKDDEISAKTDDQLKIASIIFCTLYLLGHVFNYCN